HRALRVVVALLEADVEALRARLHVVVQERERAGRLHRPGAPADADDLALGDPAAERVVEALDVRLDAVHRAHSVSAARAVFGSSEEIIIGGNRGAGTRRRRGTPSRGPCTAPRSSPRSPPCTRGPRAATAPPRAGSPPSAPGSPPGRRGARRAAA